MTDDRVNIKIDPDLFERLKEDKGRHRSWPQYFRDQLNGDSEQPAVDLGAVEAAIEELETTLPKRTADEVERRLR